MVCRTFVGKSSEVYKEITAHPREAINLPASVTARDALPLTKTKKKLNLEGRFL